MKCRRCLNKFWLDCICLITLFEILFCYVYQSNMAAMQSTIDLFLICTELENTVTKRVIQSTRHMRHNNSNRSSLQKQLNFQRKTCTLLTVTDSYKNACLDSFTMKDHMPSIAECFLLLMHENLHIFYSQHLCLLE